MRFSKSFAKKENPRNGFEPIKLKGRWSLPSAEFIGGAREREAAKAAEGCATLSTPPAQRDENWRLRAKRRPRGCDASRAPSSSGSGNDGDDGDDGVAERSEEAPRDVRAQARAHPPEQSRV